MKICPECNFENKDEALICINCGFEFNIEDDKVDIELLNSVENLKKNISSLKEKFSLSNKQQVLDSINFLFNEIQDFLDVYQDKFDEIFQQINVNLKDFDSQDNMQQVELLQKNIVNAFNNIYTILKNAKLREDINEQELQYLYDSITASALELENLLLLFQTKDDIETSLQGDQDFLQIDEKYSDMQNELMDIYEDISVKIEKFLSSDNLKDLEKLKEKSKEFCKLLEEIELYLKEEDKKEEIDNES